MNHALRRIDRLRRRLGARWVVAVSGGSDSVAMLGLLHGAGLDLSVAHLDHGARGESLEDARFVADLAGKPGPAVRPRPLASRAPGPFRGRRPQGPLCLARRGRASGEGPRSSRSATRATTRPRRSSTASSAAPARAGSRASRDAGRWPTGVTLVRPLLDVGRAELRAYLEQARPALARGRVERRPVADAGAAPPRPAPEARRATSTRTSPGRSSGSDRWRGRPSRRWRSTSAHSWQEPSGRVPRAR